MADREAGVSFPVEVGVGVALFLGIRVDLGVTGIIGAICNTCVLVNVAMMAEESVSLLVGMGSKVEVKVDVIILSQSFLLSVATITGDFSIAIARSSNSRFELHPVAAMQRTPLEINIGSQRRNTFHPRITLRLRSTLR